jgi:hypothetical protein
MLDHIRIRNISDQVNKFIDWERLQSLASDLILSLVAYAARQITSRGSRIWRMFIERSLLHTQVQLLSPYNVASITIFTLQSSTANARRLQRLLSEGSEDWRGGYIYAAVATQWTFWCLWNAIPSRIPVTCLVSQRTFRLRGNSFVAHGIPRQRPLKKPVTIYRTKTNSEEEADKSARLYSLYSFGMQASKIKLLFRK